MEADGVVINLFRLLDQSSQPLLLLTTSSQWVILSIEQKKTIGTPLYLPLAHTPQHRLTRLFDPSHADNYLPTTTLLPLDTLPNSLHLASHHPQLRYYHYRPLDQLEKHRRHRQRSRAMTRQDQR